MEVAERGAPADVVGPAERLAQEGVGAAAFSRTSQPSSSTSVLWRQRMLAGAATAPTDSQGRPMATVGAAVEPTRARADAAAMAGLGAVEAAARAAFRPPWSGRGRPKWPPRLTGQRWVAPRGGKPPDGGPGGGGGLC